ncbi:hypothetical protein, partial [Escherichia coli]|uniref:hypothetical protein n=1 Tax=Escherichia coli TaxID=562 RepID=UPI0013860359
MIQGQAVEAACQSARKSLAGRRLPEGKRATLARRSLYIDLCNCLILICSIQHQMKVNLWTKN